GLPPSVANVHQEDNRDVAAIHLNHYILPRQIRFLTAKPGAEIFLLIAAKTRRSGEIVPDGVDLRRCFGDLRGWPEARSDFLRRRRLGGDRKSVAEAALSGPNS